MCPLRYQGIFVAFLQVFFSTHKQTAQWVLSTPEAVSSFIGHVCNAASLKKIPIFVSILFFVVMLLRSDFKLNNKVKGEGATMEFLRNAHALSPSISLHVCFFFSFLHPFVLRIEDSDS